MQQGPILQLDQISKSFGQVKALQGISLSVARGEFLTLLGPSGCGKTTTLRIIAGLEQPDEGRVLLGGEDVTALPPDRRNVNTVFQSYALFPHMNVFNNIAYGLKIKKTPAPEIRQRVGQMLELVQLPGFEKRMPAQLSGGQRQRVAIARAIVNNPALLLLDEPLGALDLQLRRQMQQELKKLQRHLGITFVYITHDQEEALNMSDRIGVMHQGCIEQLDAPEEVYERPATRFVAGFIGQSNLLEVRVTQQRGSLLLLEVGAGQAAAVGQGQPGEWVTLSVRTEQVRCSQAPGEGFDLAATVKEINYTGGMLRTTLLLPDGRELVASGMGGGAQRPELGSQVYVSWPPESAVIVERGRPFEKEGA